MPFEAKNCLKESRQKGCKVLTLVAYIALIKITVISKLAMS